MSFPISPVDGQTTTINGITYVYSTASNSWTRQPTGFVNIDAAGNISAAGNITGQNFYTAGEVSATGNITANYYFGNGSQLTGIAASVDWANIANINNQYGPQQIAIGQNAAELITQIPAGFQSVIWNPTLNQFIAVGHNIPANIYNIWTSSNGTTWTQQYWNYSPHPHPDFSSIVWSDTQGQYVAVGSSNNYPVNTALIVTSPDGVTWTEQAINLFVGGLNSVAWNGSTYVAVGNDSNNSALIVTSTDGVTWTQHDPNTWGSNLTSICWNSIDNVFLAVGPDYSGGAADVFTSTDGVSWAHPVNIGASGNVVLRSVVWDSTNLQYVAVGYDDSRNALIFIGSEDATTWTQQAINTFAGALSSIIWANSQYIAVGSDSSGDYSLILTSSDGNTWTQQSTTFSSGSNLACVAWNGSNYVAMSADGYWAFIITSSDGVTWTQVPTYGQGSYSIAIGASAAQTLQGSESIAIGLYAGQTNQGGESIAIGLQAGQTNQGAYSIAIGEKAGQNNQAQYTTILNATRNELNGVPGQESSFYVAPVRNDDVNTGNVAFYNSSTYEVTWANTISIAGNITGNYYFGNGSQLTGIAATSAWANSLIGDTLSSNVLYSSLTTLGTLANLSVSGEVSATGNITGGNLSTGGAGGDLTLTGGNILGANNINATGSISTAGNITGGNLSTGGAGGDLTLTGGNILGANNINATGSISTAGNITANYYFGNGSQLTAVSVDWANIANITNNYGPTQIAIGQNAGNVQGIYAVAIGTNAGGSTQGQDAVAIGDNAGANAQTEGAIAIGLYAGQETQGYGAIAIGWQAAPYQQGQQAIAIGWEAGGTETSQPEGSIAIGTSAGGTGNASIAIGHLAGSGENNSILLNATGVPIYASNAGLFVAPVRNDLGNTGNVAFYNSETYEVTYANTISIAGNITGNNITAVGDVVGNNLLTLGVISTAGNITANYYFGNGSQLTDVVATNIYANALIGNTLSSNVLYSSLTSLGTLSNLSVSGNIDAQNASFANAAFATGNITLPTQLATKQYVDNAVSTGLQIHESVNVSTTTNLVSTYTPGGTTPTITAITGGNVLTSVGSNLSVNDQVIPSASSNGLIAGKPYFVYSAPNANSFTLTASWQGPQITSFFNGTGLSIPTVANPGIGATLTNAGTRAALVIDNVPLAVTNRVLVQYQANGALNGVYTVSNVGNATTNWVMTRSLDADQYYPQSQLGIGAGAYFYVQSGNIVGGDSYVVTTAGIIVVGTTAIDFAQFSGAVAYTGVSPVVVTGQTISLANLTGTGDTVVLNNSPTLIAPNIGNAVGNSLSVAGNIQTANYFVGDGYYISNINAANVSTTKISNGNSQANIGTIGGNLDITISSNSVAKFYDSGLSVTGAISATGNVTGNYILGNGYFLTGVITSVANINNGTSNVTVVSADGNITVGVSGVGNVVVFAPTGEYVTGVLSATGNVTGNYFIGNGSALTGVNFSQLADANTALLTINDVYLQGVTNLAVNHTGATAYTFDQYPGSNPDLYAIAGTTLAFDLTTSGHPFQIQDGSGIDYNTGLYHVTTAGVVSTGLAAQGKTSGTLYWKIPGNISGNYKYQCANHPVMVGNIVIQSSNIANALSTYTGNITANNISAVGNVLAASVSTTGNITANYYFGNGSQLTGIITQVSNISNGTSNVNIASVNANVTVSINGTPNVATFATTGEYVTGEISATGNITGNYIIGNGAILTGVNFSQLADANTANLTINEVYLQGVTNLVVNHTGATGYTFDQYPGLNPSLYAIAGTTLAFDLTTVGHPFQIQDSGGVDYNTGLYHVTTTGVVSTGVSAQGKTSGTLYWKIPGDLTGNYRYQCANHPVMNGPIVIQAANLGNALSTYTGDITAGNISVTGNITGANVNTANLSLSGNVVSDLNITGNVNANNANFVNGAFASGTVNLPTQLTTKQYVDNAVSTGLHIHQAVNVSTTTNLVSTYTPGGTTVTVTAISGGNLLTAVGSNLGVGDQVIPSATSNGLVAGFPYFVYSAPNANSFTLTATWEGSQITTFTNGTGLSIPTVANPGVGAYLTNAGTQAALVIDSVPVAVTNRVLVQFQSNGAQNGIYTVSNVGNATTNWVMTRSLDADQYYPQSDLGIGSGDYFFVQSGNTLGGSSYVLTTPGELVIGTTPLTFAQFSGAVVYTGVSPVVVSGQTISLANLTGTGDTVVLNNTPVLIAPNLGNATGNSVSVSGNVTADQVVSTVATGTAPFTVTSTTKVANLYVDRASLSDKSSVTFTAANVQYPTFAYAGLTGVYRLESNTNFSANFANGTFSALTFAGNLTGATASLTGNVVGGNVLFGTGIVSGTGNIFANLITATTTNSTTVSASGNVTGGNLLFGSGIVSGTGNIFGNIGTITTVNSTTVSASGNVTGGNILTAGQLITTVAAGTAPLVVTSNTRVANLNVASADIADRANVTFAAANIQYPTFAYAGITGTYPLQSNTAFSANFANGAFSATLFSGNLTGTTASLSGNVTGGNILTVGLISATSTITSAANITGANLLTGGQITATGNITTAGFFLGTFAGSISGNVTAPGANTQVVYNNSGNLAGSTGFTFNQASNALVVTGNVTGANLLTGGLISATSTITAGQFIGNGNTISNIQGANVSGNVTSAITAGTVTTNAQPNITSVGTLTSITSSGLVSTTGNLVGANILTAGLMSSTGNAIHGNVLTGGLITATGNIIGGNILTIGLVSSTGNAIHGNILTAGLISATGNITGNYIVGNGSLLTSITGGNVTGQVGNALIAGTVYTNAQPNITSVGTLTSLSITGNTTSGNLLTAGLISATGNATAGNLLTGGQITATGNISTAGYFLGIFAGSISGNVTAPGANTQVVYNNSGNLAGSTGFTFNQASNALVVTGNITGANILTGGFVSATSTITSAANISGANLLTGGLISATSTITAGQFIGNGNTISNIQGANVSGNVTSAVTAGTVTTNAQPNITSVGTLTSITSSGLVSTTGNLVGANILTAGLISATSTITSAANITGANLLTGGLISATGTVTAGQFVGNGNTISNIQGANVSGNVTSAVTAGTVTTNAQPNITSVGTLTSITSSGLVSTTGNLVGANILTSGLISATSTITSAANITGANIITAGLISATGNLISGGLSVTGNAIIVGNLQVNGNVTFIGSNVITTNDLYIELANNQTTYANINNAGLAVGPTSGPLTYWQYQTAGNAWTTNVAISATSNVIGGNILTAGLISATSTITSAANITGANITTAGLITATGNVIGGNVLTSGLISATSNIAGGNLLTGGQVSATGNITTAGYFVGIFAGSISGNVTAPGANTQVIYNNNGNLAASAAFTFIQSSNALVVTGNITGANITTAGVVTATGNITGGNIITSGQVSAVGNVSVGNASAVTWANATGTRAYTYYNNATSSLDTVFI